MIPHPHPRGSACRCCAQSRTPICPPRMSPASPGGITGEAPASPPSGASGGMTTGAERMRLSASTCVASHRRQKCVIRLMVYDPRSCCLVGWQQGLEPPAMRAPYACMPPSAAAAHARSRPDPTTPPILCFFLRSRFQVCLEESHAGAAPVMRANRDGERTFRACSIVAVSFNTVTD